VNREAPLSQLALTAMCERLCEFMRTLGPVDVVGTAAVLVVALQFRHNGMTREEWLTFVRDRTDAVFEFAFVHAWKDGAS
jgi:hypothetical protein